MLDLEKIRERWAKVTPIALANAFHQMARDAILLARENEEVHGLDRENGDRSAILDTIYADALPECVRCMDPTDVADLIGEVERLREVADSANRLRARLTEGDEFDWLVDGGGDWLHCVGCNAATRDAYNFLHADWCAAIRLDIALNIWQLGPEPKDDDGPCAVCGGSPGDDTYCHVCTVDADDE